MYHKHQGLLNNFMYQDKILYTIQYLIEAIFHEGIVGI